MKNKIITLSLALLCSMAVFKSYGMEKPGQEDKLDAEIMSWFTDNYEYSPASAKYNNIAAAVDAEDIKAIEAFLNQGSDVNYTSEGVPLLVRAASEGCFEIVDLLLKRGADMYREQDFDGKKYNALDWALLGGRYEIAKALIENGFDVNREGPRGFPLKIAWGKCLKLLLENGANPNKINREEIPAWLDGIVNRDREESAFGIYHDKFKDHIKLLHKHGAGLNFQDKDGKTVIFYLINERCIQLIKCLCELGIDINLPDNKGITPLEYAQKQLDHCKKQHAKDMTEAMSEMPKKMNLSLVGQRKRKSYIKKSCSASKEFVDYSQKIVTFLKEEIRKREALLAPYNKTTFDIKHESDMSAYKNVEKIEQLSETLLRGQVRGQDGRDLSPYISARAPQMLEFINYVKANGSSADKESKRFKN